MKKFFKLSVAALLLGGMVSCSSDEPAPVNPTEGQNAYLSVNIKTVGVNGSRSTTDGGYQDAVENGTGAENAVSTAHFYFFDANGIYAGTANIWNGGGASDPENDNIEYIGNNTIVLENVNDTNYPDYVLTVLNKPTSFVAPVAGETMASVAAKLANYVDNGKFVMTTSAFFGSSTTDHNPAFPWATKIDKSKFKLDPDVSKSQPIDIYVERLAAKVELAALPAVSTVDVTVFGNENPEQTAGSGAANSKLYVKVNGVGLNGTADDESYLFKQFIAGWQTGAPFDSWENATDHRSFYAKSCKYSTAAYANDATNPAGLTFTTFAALDKQVGEANYCNEYTNSAANLVKDGQVYGDRVTSLCVAATVYSDEACTKPLDLVSYNGILFTKDQYIKYVLGAMNNDGKLNFYTKEGETLTQFNQLDLLTWVAAGAGTATIKINVPADAEVELFDGEGNASTVAALNMALDTFQADMKATAYKGGMMYYTIPVEHLAATEGAENNVEGYYGVVRNHWYKITINSIKHLGHGVFDTTETIIPDQPEDPYYFLSARINIVAWKIVNQGADL